MGGPIPFFLFCDPKTMPQPRWSIGRPAEKPHYNASGNHVLLIKRYAYALRSMGGKHLRYIRARTISGYTINGLH